jgi:protein-S-isoprenylcysteine O-methyltransferase Ste14
MWSPVPAWVSLVGDALVALGLFIDLVVFRENTDGASNIRVEGGQVVISSGPYALVRHPMYAGTLLMLLATPVALGSWWALLMFIPMLAAVDLRLIEEEKFLSRTLKGYATYRSSVRYRLLPLIW